MTCAQNTDLKIIAASGKNFEVCIPFSITSIGKILSWPGSIAVSGGTLLRIDNVFNKSFKYELVSAPGDCDEKSDRLNFVTTNGYNYSGCFVFAIDGTGNKVYEYPTQIKVETGYLKKVPDSTMRGGWNYEFVKVVIPPKEVVVPDGSSNDSQIIAGIDNTVLIIAGIAIFLMMKN